MKKTILCIFTLAVLLSGCKEKAASGQDETPEAPTESVTSTIPPEPDIEENKQDESPEISSEPDTSSLTPEPDIEDTEMDGNAFLLSAPIRGMVFNLTSTQFVADDNIGFVYGEDNVNTGSYVINYDGSTVFKSASIKSDGSTYNLYDVTADKLVEGAYVMVFGDETSDGEVNASEIVIVEFY